VGAPPSRGREHRSSAAAGREGSRGPPQHRPLPTKGRVQLEGVAWVGMVTGNGASSLLPGGRVVVLRGWAGISSGTPRREIRREIVEPRAATIGVLGWIQ
jgi:hypothetical protein